MTTVAIRDFDQWRSVARDLLAHEVPPDRVELSDAWQRQGQLNFGDAVTAAASSASGQQLRGQTVFHVSRKYLDLARCVACHRHPSRWNVLYRLLWRLTHGSPRLLEVLTDDDVYQLRQWNQHVRSDAHRMKAFVRFRRCRLDGGEWFVAWHRPDHRVGRLVAPFFVDRFAAMCWSILTPDEALVWDRSTLRWGPGTARSAAPHDDELEPLWVQYYGAMFNADRVNPRVMRAQMPVRYWAALPETRIVDALLAPSNGTTRTPR